MTAIKICPLTSGLKVVPGYLKGNNKNDITIFYLARALFTLTNILQKSYGLMKFYMRDFKHKTSVYYWKFMDHLFNYRSVILARSNIKLEDWRLFFYLFFFLRGQKKSIRNSVVLRAVVSMTSVCCIFFCSAIKESWD